MKGIMFTEPLFPKVVKGEKTQTRRIITPEPTIQNDWVIKPKSKYKVGEIVYLKEPYVLYDEQYQELRTNASGIQFAYRYGNNIPIAEITGKSDSKWKNKLFMPESAARYFIKIIAVRAEKLQNISEEDCFKEGIKLHQILRLNERWFENGLVDKSNTTTGYLTAQKAYAALINKINGKGTWESDPFVWIYDFELTNNK